jgi:hydrogenase maturation protease
MRGRILVVGLGNILLSDEGVGVAVVRRLAAEGRLPAGVEVIDGGTCGMDLLPEIAGADRMIVVDAARTGKAPGTVLEIDGEDMPAFFTAKMSPHQRGFTDMLATLDLHDARPREVMLVAVEPEDLSLSLNLSATCTQSADKALHLVRARLSHWTLENALLAAE